ncbi:CRISPR-associated endonuclease Cas2 [uncultured Treponema sp.]|uniref:CRISPR-associated endonuclease Cas2 n=1 Tax=uncultured Treponema sp. TaxID=162155 RepID=UPI002597A614|nr:CRISPR-associated endonuclease Cas2 [uncultured Treponema sp.]
MSNLELNRYELMWMMVLFDLPVIEKKERKAATDFRNFLLDNGFSMVQYSIYTKLFSGKDACEKYYKLIVNNLPPYGKVDILTITDRQYSNIISYSSGDKIEKNSRNSLCYSEILTKKIRPMYSNSLKRKELHWTYYN